MIEPYLFHRGDPEGYPEPRWPGWAQWAIIVLLTAAAVVAVILIGVGQYPHGDGIVVDVYEAGGDWYVEVSEDDGDRAVHQVSRAIAGDCEPRERWEDGRCD